MESHSSEEGIDKIQYGPEDFNLLKGPITDEIIQQSRIARGIIIEGGAGFKATHPDFPDVSVRHENEEEARKQLLKGIALRYSAQYSH